MSSVVVGAGVAAAIGIPLVVRALRWLFPSRPLGEDDPSMEDLEGSYATCDRALLVTSLVCAPIVGYFAYRGISAACSAVATALPPADIVLFPAGAVCGIPAIFIAIGWCVVPATLLVRLRFGGQYDRYARYRELRFGIARRGWRSLLLGYSAVCAVWVVLILDWNVRFTDRDVVINRLWSFTAEEHPYSDIVEIRTAPWLTALNGKRVQRREYFVRFRSGQTWSTSYDPSDATPKRKKQIAELMSSRSGVPITEVPLLSIDESY